MALPNRFEEHPPPVATAHDMGVDGKADSATTGSRSAGNSSSPAVMTVVPDSGEADSPVAISKADEVDTEALAREARELARQVRRQSTDLMDLMALPPAERLGLRLGRRERRRLETFERLVAVSRDILFAQNLKQVSVEDITTGADTGKGTFFNYFPSKEQVVPSQLALIWRELSESVARIERDGVPAPTAVVDRFVDYLCPPSGAWLTYEQNLMQGLLDPEVRKAFAARLAPNAALYVRMMELGQRQGTVRTDVSAEDLGQHLHMVLVGLTVLYWIHGAPPSRDAVREVATVAISAIKPPVATAAPAAPATKVSKIKKVNQVKAVKNVRTVKAVRKPKATAAKKTATKRAPSKASARTKKRGAPKTARRR